MDEYEESLYGIGETLDFCPPPPRRPVARERIHIQKSSVCSRAYFVVVMAFFHIYIINIIALLLYVHYNTGSGETPGGEQDVPLERSTSVPRPIAAEHQSPSPNVSPEHSFYLPRLEGIRVGHVQRVSLVPDRTHSIRTLSLKPLLFGTREQTASRGRCGRAGGTLGRGAAASWCSAGQLLLVIHVPASWASSCCCIPGPGKEPCWSGWAHIERSPGVPSVRWAWHRCQSRAGAAVERALAVS